MKKRALVVVAHPDDETLWAGGEILSHPEWSWIVVSLCRGDDSERAVRFYDALNILNATGVMGSLDDSPELKPLDDETVQKVILDLLPPTKFNIIISHSPEGEYTRHLRHEETGRAVISLWHAGKIFTDELRVFAYEDRNNKLYPEPIAGTQLYNTLTERIWLMKYKLITETYGFAENSWEAKTTPKAESFRLFTNSDEAFKWLNKKVALK